MTAYAVGLAALFATLSIIGRAEVAGALAAVVILSGGLILRSYQRRVTGHDVPAHRAKLDRLVLRQWGLSGGLGLTVALVVGTNHNAQIGAGHLVQALAVGAAIALTAVFVSSLADWYWVLPRVGGIGGVAPCQAPGERWKGLTAIWLFHRGVATTFVVAAVAGVPVYLATDSKGASAIAYGILGAVLGGAVALINRRGIEALTTAFNQPIYVGDTILVSHPGSSEGDPTVRRRAYVVDVSIQGVKYQLLSGDEFTGPAFERKGHGPTERSDDTVAIATTARTEGQLAVPCPKGHCSGVNWYCRCNTHAYDY